MRKSTDEGPSYYDEGRPPSQSAPRVSHYGRRESLDGETNKGSTHRPARPLSAPLNGSETKKNVRFSESRTSGTKGGSKIEVEDGSGESERSDGHHSPLRHRDYSGRYQRRRRRSRVECLLDAVSWTVNGVFSLPKLAGETIDGLEDLYHQFDTSNGPPQRSSRVQSSSNSPERPRRPHRRTKTGERIRREGSERPSLRQPREHRGRNDSTRGPSQRLRRSGAESNARRISGATSSSESGEEGPRPPARTSVMTDPESMRRDTYGRSSPLAGTRTAYAGESYAQQLRASSTGGRGFRRKLDTERERHAHVQPSTFRSPSTQRNQSPPPRHANRRFQSRPSSPGVATNPTRNSQRLATNGYSEHTQHRPPPMYSSVSANPDGSFAPGNTTQNTQKMQHGSTSHHGESGGGFGDSVRGPLLLPTPPSSNDMPWTRRSGNDPYSYV